MTESGIQKAGNGNCRLEVAPIPNLQPQILAGDGLAGSSPWSILRPMTLQAVAVVATAVKPPSLRKSRLEREIGWLLFIFL